MDVAVAPSLFITYMQCVLCSRFDLNLSIRSQNNHSITETTMQRNERESRNRITPCSFSAKYRIAPVPSF